MRPSGGQRPIRIAQDRFDIDTRIGDRVVTATRLLRQTPLEHEFQSRMQILRQLVPVGLRFQNIRQDMWYRLALEQRQTAQHLEQHDAERPDVGALIGRLTARLLGTHVAGRAEDDALLRHRKTQGRRLPEACLVGFFGERLGQAEVEHLDLTFGRDHDVGGFQVPVHDTLLVRGLERLGDLQRERQRVFDR